MNRTQLRKATTFEPSLSRADVKYRQRNANKQVRQAAKLEIGYALTPEFEFTPPVAKECEHHLNYDSYASCDSEGRDMDVEVAYCDLCDFHEENFTYWEDFENTGDAYTSAHSHHDNWDGVEAHHW